jgi:PAS domain S-box-containing protein
MNEALEPRSPSGDGAPATAVGVPPTDVQFLAQSATALLELPPDGDVSGFIAEHLRAFLGDCLVSVSAVDARARTLTVAALAGDRALLDRLASLLEGCPSAGVPVDDGAHAAMMSRRLLDIPGGLASVFLGQCPPARCAEVAAALGVRRVYGMGLVCDGAVRGNLVIFWRAQAELLERLVIEAFGNQAAAALRRRDAEAALRESERRFREIADFLPVALMEADLAGRIGFANRRTHELTGYDERDFGGGVSLMDLLAPEERDRARQAIGRVHEGDARPGNEYRAVRKDGSSYYIAVYATPIVRAGRTVGMRGLAVDVTERRRAEESLRESERRFRELASLLPVGVIEFDLGGRITFANAATLTMTGYADADVATGLSVAQLVVPDDRPRVADRVRGLLTGGTSHANEYTAQRQDGSTFTVAIFASAIERGGAAVGLRGIALDVSERARAEAALKDSERRYRELVELLPQTVFECDLDGRVVFLNRHGLEAGGLDRAALDEGLQLHDVVGPEHQEAARLALRAVGQGHEIRGEEFTTRRRDGSTRHVIAYVAPVVREGRPVGVRGVAVDVTDRRRIEEDRRRLEAQMQHAQKLESLGVLAGGIAHDFNNLLVAILGNAELALGDLPPRSFAAERLARIRRAAQRAADLTGQMLAYAGRGHLETRPLDLNAIIEETGHLLGAAIAKTATLRYELSADLPLVEGDAVQMRQVVMNLLINASDALDGQPGVITLRSGLGDVSAARLGGAYCGEGLPVGSYVCLEVGDTGCGIDPATQGRIFEPFFTTKFTGRGLGLAAVLGIVRGHHGAIEVESAPGRGATFRVLLPAPASPPEEQGATPTSGATAWAGRGLVLVVDDEEDVRETARAMLERSGFQVLTAADGLEGLRMLGAHPGEIRLVLLDLTMPRMSGEEAFREMRRVAPHVPIVLASGYSHDDIRVRFAGTDLAGALTKPFTMAALLGVLRHALEEAPKP